MMTPVKICGISNPEDAFAACDCGAEALGFIFFEPSPRYLEPIEARKIIQTLPPGIAKVGVFVNPEISLVRNLREYCRLDFIQLSGDEPPDFCSQIPASILLKVISSHPGEGPGNLDLYRARAFLIDSREPGVFGGTGRLSNWGLAKAIGGRRSVVLAGGLNPENVEAAIAAVSPAAVDVSSGVEIYPGKKDLRKMRLFIERAHSASGGVSSRIFRLDESLSETGEKLRKG
jgi:phosphoribosylanthranilate isomerase